MRVPVWPPYCTATDPALRLDSDSSCKGNEYSYAVTDGTNPYANNESYADGAIRNCEYTVGTSGTPHRFLPNPHTTNCFDGGVCPEAGRAQRDTNVGHCRVMRNEDGILSNLKNTTPAYKDQYKASLRARVDVTRLRAGMHRTGSNAISGFVRDRVIEELRSCRRLGILSEHDVTTILTAPTGTPGGSGGSSTGSTSKTAD